MSVICTVVVSRARPHSHFPLPLCNTCMCARGVSGRRKHIIVWSRPPVETGKTESMDASSVAIRGQPTQRAIVKRGRRRITPYLITPYSVHEHALFSCRSHFARIEMGPPPPLPPLPSLPLPSRAASYLYLAFFLALAGPGKSQIDVPMAAKNSCCLLALPTIIHASALVGTRARDVHPAPEVLEC